MMDSRPQDTRGIIKIAVGLDVEGQTAVFTIRQSGSDSCRRAVSDTVGSVPADELIVFREIPQPRRPPALEDNIGDQGPIVVLDHIPQLGRHPCGRNRARVPAPGSLLQVLFMNPLRYLCVPRGALLENSFAVRSYQAFARFNERGQ